MFRTKNVQQLKMKNKLHQLYLLLSKTALLFLLASAHLLHSYDVTFQPIASTAYEQGTVNGTCRLSRIGTSGQLDVSIQISAGSSATLTTDYSLQWYHTTLAMWLDLGADEGTGIGGPATNGKIRFHDGESAVDIRLVPVDDAVVEGRRYVLCSIVSNPALYNSGPIVTQRFTIADNDHKGHIEVIQPIADEDTALRGDPDDSISLRRGIIRVQFDQFSPAGSGTAFARNLAVQFFDSNGSIPPASLGTDYTVKYKIGGHNQATATNSSSQIGRIFNAQSGESTTTGIKYRLMAALAGENVIPLQEQDPSSTSVNTVPPSSLIYFESDPSQTIYTVSVAGPSSMQLTTNLLRPVPSGTKVKIVRAGATGTSSAPDSVVVERTYPASSTSLKVGEGFGLLYEGDVIQLEGDSLTYVITSDPNPAMVADVNGRLSGTINIFAFEGGVGGGLAVAQNGPANVTTLITPTINSLGIMQLLIPSRANKLEISIEPADAGDGAEGAEAVRMRMIADEDYIIESPQDTQVTIADRDVIAGVTVENSAGLPNIQGSFRFSISQAYSRTIEVPFLLTDINGSTLVANTGEGTTFQTLARKVTFTPGQTSVLLPVIPISTGTQKSIKITLLSGEDYKLGGSTSSSLNPSATMHINNVSGTASITATTATAVESASPTNGNFRISISRLGGTAAVPLRLVVSGTATNAARYEFFDPASPTTTYNVVAGELNQISIASGQNSVDIGVRPIDNLVADGSQTVQLSLNNQGMSYAIGAPNSATITITDNEPTIFVSVISNAVRPSTSGIFRFSYPGVPAGTALSQAVTVNFTYSGATNNVDFIGNTSVTIQPNTLSADLSITPTVSGTASSVTVTLNSSSSYNIGAPGNATMTISDTPDNPTDSNKATPGAVNSGSNSSSCGLGSGFATFVLLGLCVVGLSLRRRQ